MRQWRDWRNERDGFGDIGGGADIGGISSGDDDFDIFEVSDEDLFSIDKDNLSVDDGGDALEDDGQRERRRERVCVASGAGRGSLRRGVDGGVDGDGEDEREGEEGVCAESDGGRLGGRVVGRLMRRGEQTYGEEVGSEDAAHVDGGVGIENDGFGEVDERGEGGTVAVGVEDAVAAMGHARGFDGDADALLPAVVEEEVEGGVVEAAEDEAVFLLALLQLAGEFDLLAGGGERREG